MHYKLSPANFEDYRDFLVDRYQNLKDENPVYSLQYCASKSGLSKSHIQFLFKLERHISLDKFPLLAKTLKLTDEEEYFVYLMICKNTSKNVFVQNHFEKILSRIRFYSLNVSNSPVEISNEDISDLYDKMPLVLLQTFISLSGFQEDPKWILKNFNMPNMSISSIKSLLTELEERGMAYRDHDGKLLSNDAYFHQTDPYDPNALSPYTKITNFLAELMKYPDLYKPSSYSSVNIALDENNLKKVEKLMSEMHHKISIYAEESINPTVSVYISNYFLTIGKISTIK
jgi:uncharacterized protein (TIGR02147 family)